MTSRDLVDQAVQAVLAHRLRAALSATGIVFGVATVVTALAIGEGARREALAEIGGLGIDNLFVRAVRREADPPAGSARAPELSLRDAGLIEQRVAEVALVASVRPARAEMHAGARRATGSLLGVTRTWAGAANVQVGQGRWLNERDERSHRRVAVIGHGLAASLFPGIGPVGREVRAGDAWYGVVGVLQEAGRPRARRVTIQPHDPDLALVVPLGAMDVSLGTGDRLERVEEIVVRTAGADAVPRVSAAIERVLARRSAAEKSFEIVVPRQLLQARLRTQRTFNVVLLAVGGLALLISGVGVMNIMLAGVVERTHEIGVRRAFGARRRDIVAQFAVEAVALCFAGGLAGVPLGVALSGAVAVLAGWPMAISAFSVALALGMATAVGLLSGIHPARLAARLDPAAALRRE
jgi:putative ABC transport system permease protein